MTHALSTNKLLPLKGKAIAMGENINNNPEQQQQNEVKETLYLQVLNIKPIQSRSGDRLRLVLSDSEYFVQGMLASQLTETIGSKLQTFDIVEINDYMVNVVNQRTVFIILAIHVFDDGQHNPGQKIGNPINIEDVTAPLYTPTSSTTNNTPQPLYNSTNGMMGGIDNKPKSVTPSSNPYGSSQTRSSPVRSVPTNPIMRNNNVSTGYTPIASLNMYNNRWTIQARLTSKSDIRTWSNARGEGSLFSIELLDSTQDIRATFFKEAVDRFYNMLDVGKVYTFSGGRLKVANAQYNTCKSSFEITFDQNAEIHLSNDEGNIQEQVYDFVKIANIEQIEPNKNIDVLAIVKTVMEPVNLVSKKTGQELTKCELVLVDDSGAEINLTIWGDKAHTAQQDYANNPVVAFRRARVGDYNGRNLSAGQSNQIEPTNIPEVTKLKQWWRTDGTTSRSLSAAGVGGGRVESFQDRKTISSIKDENMGLSEKPDWLSFKARISFLKKDKEGGAWYPACANSGDPCKNMYKATKTPDGQWYCEKCQGTYPNPVYRWIFSGTVADYTGTTWVNFFNEQAETLFNGTNANSVQEQLETGNLDTYDSTFLHAMYQEFIFKCKVKQEIYNDNEPRLKTAIYSIQPVDYVKESIDLLTAIEQM